MSKETALSNLKSGLPIPPEFIKLGFEGLVELIKLAFERRGMLKQRQTVLEGIVQSNTEISAERDKLQSAAIEQLISENKELVNAIKELNEKLNVLTELVELKRMDYKFIKNRKPSEDE